VRVKVAPGTPSGRVLRVKGRGVSGRGGTGDLLAKVTVIVPQRLTDAAREAVEVLREQEADVDPRAEVAALRARVSELTDELGAARHTVGHRVFAAGPAGDIVAMRPGQRPSRPAGPSRALVVWRPQRG
jgi:hypothetical protein